MNYKKFELHIAQVNYAIGRFRKHYPDLSHQKAYNDLTTLFRKIENSNYQNFSEDDLISSKKVLDEVYSGIEHLHYGRSYEIPHEIIFCLELVLSDWIDNSNQYLIVTSLNNKLEQYEIFAPTKGFQDKLTQNITNLFGHSYKQLLVRIGKPKLLINNYLTGVAMYHELGHFIDRYYRISEIIIFYEPKLNYILSKPKNEIEELWLHYSEYFADLFAAQYIGISCLEYLNYISYKSPSSHTHPATSKRNDVVEKFLSGIPIPEVEYIKKWTKIRATGREIEIRSIPLDKNPFLLDHPIKLNNINQVHSLFGAAWQHWLDENCKIRLKYKNSTKTCNRINRITKDTIKSSIPNNKINIIRYITANIAHYYSTIVYNLFQQ